MIVYILFIVWLSLITIIHTQGENLLNLISQIETELKSSANILESQFNKRCNNICQKSYRGCSSYLPKFDCSKEFDEKGCECYLPSGSIVNMEESIVNIVGEPFNITQDQAELICSTEIMNSLFIETRQKFPQIRWQYVGTYNGLMRSYPGQDECNYEPRGRPWYLAGATGAKNVIILIDVSGSMEEHQKLAHAVNASKGVVDTLGFSDWMGIVSFSTEAKSDFYKLIRATKSNRNIVKGILDRLTTGGQTNFEKAFNKTYEIVGNSTGDILGPISCETVILFMTDGSPSLGETNIKKIGEMIIQMENETKANATIISYAFGANAFPNDLKHISCATNGITEHVEFPEKIEEKMMSYYIFLSSGFTNSKVIWTEPYEDESGLGNITSAVIPFYEKLSSDVPLLLGVLGIDLTLSELNKYNSTDTILKQLVTQNKECTRLSLSLCQLEKLRGKYNCEDPKISNCTNKGSWIPVCDYFPYSPFYDETKVRSAYEKINNCCGIDDCTFMSNMIIISVIFGIVFLIFMIAAVCCIINWRRNYVPQKIQTCEVNIVTVYLEDTQK